MLLWALSTFMLQLRKILGVLLVETPVFGSQPPLYNVLAREGHAKPRPDLKPGNDRFLQPCSLLRAQDGGTRFVLCPLEGLIDKRAHTQHSVTSSLKRTAECRWKSTWNPL